MSYLIGEALQMPLGWTDENEGRTMWGLEQRRSLLPLQLLIRVALR